MKTILALWGMARPLIMLSVILVYGAGLLIARADGYVLEWGRVVWGLVIILLASLSIHYTNEYADYETDALTTPTMYSGGSGVLARGDVPRQLAMQAAWGTLLLSIVVALVGMVSGYFSVVPFILLVVGVVGGWMYSLPPLKLAWRGWGEADNAILGGMILHLYGYSVVTETMTMPVVAAVVPFTLLVFTNLLATTWADRVADAQVGKFTLATQLSIPQLRLLYGGVALVAFFLLPALYDWALPASVVVGSLAAIPMMLWGWLTYTRIHNPYPTSNAMVVLLLGQMAGWYIAG